MGIFDKIFKKDTPKDEGTKDMSFSTPFYKIGKGNLSMPFVSPWQFTGPGYIRFGADNMYPQLLNQLSLTTPLHGAIINFTNNAIVGGGWEWRIPPNTGKEKVDLLTYERVNKLKELVRLISRDILIHNRVTIIMCRQENGTYTMKRLDPSTIRTNRDGSKFAYSLDWSRGEVETRFYNRWTPGCKEYETLYIWNYNSAGQDYYPLPIYNSVLNWAGLDAEMSYFHKQNILNSVFPSMVIRRPKDFASMEEAQRFQAGLKSKQGAENAGNVLVLTGPGYDMTPEVSFPTPNANDATFLETAKQLADQVCFAWSINPSIMGIKVAGSLGNKEELEISYSIWEKNMVLPLRAQLEEILGGLFDATGLRNEIVFNNFQIIEKEIKEA
jgi:hypothetical protein